MVETLYKEPDHPIIVGSFLEKEPIRLPIVSHKSAAKKKKKAMTKPTQSKGIRFYMANVNGSVSASGPSQRKKSDSKLLTKIVVESIELSDSE